MDGRRLDPMHPRLDYILLALVVALGVFILYPPGLVNEALLWDDKAYVNNALIASGRIRAKDVWGPYAEERPPLFWWLLTGLYMLGVPTWAARLISPTFGLLVTVALYVFASRIFGDVWVGFLSSMLLLSSSFFVSTSSNILTDTMGAALSALYMLSLLAGFRHRPLLWVSGPLLSLSIAARDQNLVVLPAMMIFFLWASKIRLREKLILLFAVISLASPIAFAGMENVLQMLSDTLTPFVIHPLFLPMTLIVTGLNVILITYPRREAIEDGGLRFERIVFDLGLAIFLSIIFLYPYLIDNYRLGVEYQVAGRGILSRPVSHLIMARELGMGMELPAWERRLWWIRTASSLISIPVLVLAAGGAIHLLYRRELAGKLLTIWASFSLLYVILFTHLEARFIVQSFPPIFILAGYALSSLIRRRRFFGCVLFAALPFFLLFPGFPLPNSIKIPPTLLSLLKLTGSASSGELWLTPYLEYLAGIKGSEPRIEPIYPALGLSSLIISLLAIYLALRRKN